MEVGSGLWLAILGVIGLVNSLAVAVVGAFMNSRLTRQSQHGAEAIERAKQAVENAKKEATESVRQLLTEARRTDSRVRGVGRVAEEARDISIDTNKVARDTHDLLNGGHIKLLSMLRTVVALSERIAHENPEDEDARNTAERARSEYDKARERNE